MGGLTNLTELDLRFNEIEDISPLVENSKNGGLGEGDLVWLTGNPLDLRPGSQACADIQALRENGVEVYVEEGC